jgi:hypothetical protein
MVEHLPSKLKALLELEPQYRQNKTENNNNKNPNKKIPQPQQHSNNKKSDFIMIHYCAKALGMCSPSLKMSCCAFTFSVEGSTL